MEKIKFNTSEVYNFLEEKVILNLVTEEELVLYEEYIWSDKINKNYTYKCLVREMRELYNERY
jgi:hypothetical protein